MPHPRLNPEQRAVKEVATHSELAQAIAEGRADAGLGIEAAASAWGLDSILGGGITIP